MSHIRAFQGEKKCKQIGISTHLDPECTLQGTCFLRRQPLAQEWSRIFLHTVYCFFGHPLKISTHKKIKNGIYFLYESFVHRQNGSFSKCRKTQKTTNSRDRPRKQYSKKNRPQVIDVFFYTNRKYLAYWKSEICQCLGGARA